MKFVLHEIKLWFKDTEAEPKNYKFLPDKVNVITGDSNTGKTSFWNIIDYCFLSGKVNIANTIIDKVLWFGIYFSINDKQISIVRKTPEKGAVSSEVSFNLGSFPVYPKSNKEIAEIKSMLDNEFGITDSLRFPFGKEMGSTSFNLSYRHFLIFNSLTENIIGAQETYFDTTFYGKEEYDKSLNHIFNMVIGVDNMKKIKASEQLKVVEKKIRKIKRQEKNNQKTTINLETEIRILFDKCKKYNFIDYSEPFETIETAIPIIQDVVSITQKIAQNSNLFEEIDELNKRRIAIRSQIEAITQYQKEFDAYKRNLSKSADSLQPIEFLNKNLSDQLVDSYETKAFIDSLESSLKSIKDHLSNKITKPIKIAGDVKELSAQLKEVESQISKLNEIQKNYLAESRTEAQKFIVLGEIKQTLEQLLKSEPIKPIDNIRLNSLIEESENLAKIPDESKQIEFSLKTELNKSIQRNFNQLKSMTVYSNSRLDFNSDKMILQLYPEGQLFPLDNVGSKSNYMFMHLCVYLGLHEHILSVNPEHVPQFLFIDQPSIPYYAGSDNIQGNDDRSKLIDAFTLINSFIEYIVKEKGNSFQIFMVEHASKDYWEKNDLTHFHTVDEFINGKGLIPKEIYNKN